MSKTKQTLETEIANLTSELSRIERRAEDARQSGDPELEEMLEDLYEHKTMLKGESQQELQDLLDTPRRAAADEASEI